VPLVHVPAPFVVGAALANKLGIAGFLCLGQFRVRPLHSRNNFGVPSTGFKGFPSHLFDFSLISTSAKFGE
jgi:hypothetical protein